MKNTKYLLIPLIAILVLFASCTNPDSNQNKNTRSKVYWTCTMHPQVHKDGPGTCPICGMDLVKKVVDDTTNVSASSDMNGMISLSSGKQILANVSTVKVVKGTLNKQLSVYSYMDFVEQNRKTIPAKFNGRIEKLFVDKTGDYIKKGQALFDIYSPELVQAQNDYLITLSTGGDEGNSMVEASKKKLELFGLTTEQIENLTNTREVILKLTYFSPVSGTVIEKKVQEGMYVSEGSVIYEIAELSTLWNIAEVSETDLSNVKVGSKVILKLKAYPGEEFMGRVTFIYPVINSQTRTVKVRSEFSSYSGKIKPQMYGETVFSSTGGEGLLVPADAVVIAGNRSIIWEKTGDGMFEARLVQLGQRYGDKYQILSGINEGDEIAVTGGFLIDSESQLKTGMPTGHQPGSITPVQEKSSPDNMPGMDMSK